MAFSIPSIATLNKLLKSSLTVEAQEKIISLREAALELQQENLDLRQRIAELESLDGEQCPKCHRKTYELISSKADPTFEQVGAMQRIYECSECGFSEPTTVLPE